MIRFISHILPRIGVDFLNRREIKLTAKSRAAQAGKPAKLLTLVTLISQAVLLGLQYAANELSAHIGSSSNYLSATVASGARSLLLSLAIGLVIQAVMQMIRAGYTLGALRIHRQEEVPMNTLLEGFYMPLRVSAGNNAYTAADRMELRLPDPHQLSGQSWLRSLRLQRGFGGNAHRSHQRRSGTDHWRRRPDRSGHVDRLLSVPDDLVSVDGSPRCLPMGSCFGPPAL